MSHDTAFEMASSSIRFGPGVTREVGADVADLGAHKVLVIADPRLVGKYPVNTVLESLEAERLEVTLFDRIRVEPTDESFGWAIAAAVEDARKPGSPAEFASRRSPAPPNRRRSLVRTG